MGVNPKIGGKPPNHPFVHRVFHCFHHPFWGFSPYIWFNTPMDLLSGVFTWFLSLKKKPDPTVLWFAWWKLPDYQTSGHRAVFWPETRSTQIVNYPGFHPTKTTNFWERFEFLISVALLIMNLEWWNQTRSSLLPRSFDAWLMNRCGILTCRCHFWSRQLGENGCKTPSLRWDVWKHLVKSKVDFRVFFCKGLFYLHPFWFVQKKKLQTGLNPTKTPKHVLL